MSPYDETTLFAVAPDMPPSLDHWFGTTSRGQDVFWQMTAALRNTLDVRHPGRGDQPR